MWRSGTLTTIIAGGGLGISSPRSAVIMVICRCGILSYRAGAMHIVVRLHDFGSLWRYCAQAIRKGGP